jgi:uncharacterized surface protein with fasciclin (FAS1) repeats
MGTHALPGHFVFTTNGRKRMKGHALILGVASLALAVTACNKGTTGGNGSAPEQPKAAQKAAGNKTIASGLPANSKFMAAAKAAGLDQTLAGPGPYTVFVPDDAAFDKAPAGTFNTDPKNRAQLTSVITNLILPGTVLVADIDKAIDQGKGKATLATMGGDTLTATRNGDKTLLTDSKGDKATITQGDEQYTNGVVHHLDGVLLPSRTPAANAPAVGQKAGK